MKRACLMLKMFVTEPLCYPSKMLFANFDKLFVTHNMGRGAPIEFCLA